MPVSLVFMKWKNLKKAQNNLLNSQIKDAVDPNS